MFTVEGRRLVEDRLLAMAQANERVVAGAAVGPLARGAGDRFSDVDLTFGIVADVPLTEVLTDRSAVLGEEFGAVRLFNLPSGGALYRVFLAADCLQIDLSVASASQFGAMGPDFRLLFGKAVSVRRRHRSTRPSWSATLPSTSCGRESVSNANVRWKPSTLTGTRRSRWSQRKRRFGPAMRRQSSPSHWGAGGCGSRALRFAWMASLLKASQSWPVISHRPTVHRLFLDTRQLSVYPSEPAV